MFKNLREINSIIKELEGQSFTEEDEKMRKDFIEHLKELKRQEKMFILLVIVFSIILLSLFASAIYFYFTYPSMSIIIFVNLMVIAVSSALGMWIEE